MEEIYREDRMLNFEMHKMLSVLIPFRPMHRRT